MMQSVRRALPMVLLALGLVLTLVGGFGVGDAGAIDNQNPVYDDDPYPDDDIYGSTTSTTTVPETTTTVAETTTTVAETTTTVAETTTTVPTSVLASTTVQNPENTTATNGAVVSPAELAVTGTSSLRLAAIGMIMFVAGALMLGRQARATQR